MAGVQASHCNCGFLLSTLSVFVLCIFQICAHLELLCLVIGLILLSLGSEYVILLCEQAFTLPCLAWESSPTLVGCNCNSGLISSLCSLILASLVKLALGLLLVSIVLPGVAERASPLQGRSVFGLSCWCQLVVGLESLSPVCLPFPSRSSAGAGSLLQALPSTPGISW